MPRQVVEIEFPERVGRWFGVKEVDVDQMDADSIARRFGVRLNRDRMGQDDLPQLTIVGRRVDGQTIELEVEGHRVSKKHLIFLETRAQTVVGVLPKDVSVRPA